MNAPPTAHGARALIVAAIVKTAPDVGDDIEELDDDIDLFEEYGLDSMDRVSIMAAIAQSTGVEISDERFPQLTTMNALIGHVAP